MSQEEIKTLEKKVDRILLYLHNDDETGTKGLVAEVAILKSQLSEFKNDYKRDNAVKHAKASVWGLVGGGFITLVAWLIKVFS